MEPRITVSEEARAMRVASGIRSITDAELRVLTKSTSTKTTPRVAANEPPDGYAAALLALDKQRQPQPPTPTPTHIDPLDGYALTLNKPRPTHIDPLDGYAVALEKRRQEAL